MIGNLIGDDKFIFESDSFFYRVNFFGFSFVNRDFVFFVFGNVFSGLNDIFGFKSIDSYRG